ncbi:hypothetical protein SAMN04488583_0672 [Mycobacterium sp. 88mf]|nr:hypothetical protein SAMN04488583_0672 [Mycobacterium sp. 88mf]SFF09188.1 hypothetical protein SAMN04488582_101244 [Mycobacterium sp. 455mf]
MVNHRLTVQHRKSWLSYATADQLMYPAWYQIYTR